ncbi:MAG: peptidyl-prolyl cis-trans isomerase [Pseudomonadales bacterium]|nr:peptidyl-prolyl cis-trans isomerase [Pseudomonadales bacterium]
MTALVTTQSFATETNKANPTVTLTTDMGNIVIELYPDAAPISVRNFLNYVRSGYYENTLFHRVIPNFMVQAGGFNEQMQRKETEAPIQNEANNGLKNQRGTIAMARTNQVHSATSQFFINVVDNNYLNHSPSSFGYAVFGRVIEGMEIADNISKVSTGYYQGMQNVPVTPIKITKATIKSP